MTLRHRIMLFLAGLSVSVPVLFNSCGTSIIGNPVTPKTSFAIKKYQNITSLDLCLTQMTLETSSGEFVTVPFSQVTQLSIPLNGIDLESLQVPAGQYTSISLKLANVCGTGASLALTNYQGSYTSSSPISLAFSGNEFVGFEAQKILLDIQSLAISLTQVSSNADIAAVTASTLGNYYSANCGMQTNLDSVAFCETFDRPSAVVSRSGQLNSSVWNVSRAASSNQGQGILNAWNPSTIDACGTLQAARPDGTDVLICKGQLRESTNDNGDVTALTMSPRQPFDFSGRTGTVAFDVTNDTSGPSGVWPEIWITDQSLPGFQLFNEIQSLPTNGVVIRFNGNLEPFAGGSAPGCSNDSNARWIVGSVAVIRNHVAQIINWSDHNNSFQTLGCVIASEGSSGKMNHIELRVSQNKIEVFATDAGSPALKKIALLDNLSLPFNEGYITLSDNHNDAAHGPNPNAINHTFAWDNVTFDGPSITADLGFDVLDRLTTNTAGSLNLGWEATPSAPVSLSTIALSSADVASETTAGASLTFNFYVPFNPITTINYTVNGVPLVATVPFATANNHRYSLELPAPPQVTLVPGAQSISIRANDIFIIYNVSLKLPGAGN